MSALDSRDRGAKITKGAALDLARNSPKPGLPAMGTVRTFEFQSSRDTKPRACECSREVGASMCPSSMGKGAECWAAGGGGGKPAS